MSISYMCPYCNDMFDSVVRADRHKKECSERPHNRLSDGTDDSTDGDG